MQLGNNGPLRGMYDQPEPEPDEPQPTIKVMPQGKRFVAVLQFRGLSEKYFGDTRHEAKQRACDAARVLRTHRRRKLRLGN